MKTLLTLTLILISQAAQANGYICQGKNVKITVDFADGRRDTALTTVNFYDSQVYKFNTVYQTASVNGGCYIATDTYSILPLQNGSGKITFRSQHGMPHTRCAEANQAWVSIDLNGTQTTVNCVDSQ